MGAKHAFECFAHTHDVTIRHYRADNGAFNTHLFKESILAARQTIDFCGADAHHQNGVAERMIGTLVFRARSMLLDAMLKWPEVITTELWPYAIKLSSDITNSAPLENGLSPIELFASVKAQTTLPRFHPFGSPVFVLDPQLCQNKSIPKWKPRSRMGVYLGHSPQHAGNVCLVLNPNTRYISPQFHTVHDDDFTTTSSRTTNTLPSNWDDLFSNHREFPPEDFNHSLSPQWTKEYPSSVPSLDTTSIPSEGASIPSEGASIPSEGDSHGIAETINSSNDSKFPSSNSHPPIITTTQQAPAREGESTSDTVRTRSGHRVVPPSRLIPPYITTFGFLKNQCLLVVSSCT